VRKDQTLSNSADYQRVFQQNKSLRDRYWLILWCPNDQDGPRLGIAVAKKKVKKAVQRNRLKRIIRESFRQNRKLIGARDVIVLVNQGVEKAKNPELFASLTRMWKKVATNEGNPKSKNTG